MKNPQRLADKSLVATCALIAVMPIRDECTLGTWLDCLRDVLPETADCGSAMKPLRQAAVNLVNAKPGDERSNRLTRMGYEVCHFLGHAAASRYEAWQTSDRNEEATA